MKIENLKDTFDQAHCHGNLETLPQKAHALVQELMDDGVFSSWIRFNSTGAITGLGTSDPDGIEKLHKRQVEAFLEDGKLSEHPQVKGLMFNRAYNLGQFSAPVQLDLQLAHWNDKGGWLDRVYFPIGRNLRFSNVFPVGGALGQELSAITILRDGAVPFSQKEQQLLKMLAEIFLSADIFLQAWKALEGRPHLRWVWLWSKLPAKALAHQLNRSEKSIELYRAEIRQHLGDAGNIFKLPTLIDENKGRLDPLTICELGYDNPPACPSELAKAYSFPA